MTPRIWGFAFALWVGTSGPVVQADPVAPDGYVVERYATGIGAANALAFGPDGVLYITDYQAGRLLKRTCTGELQVVASGLANAVGVAVSASGRIFVAAGDTRVYEIVSGRPRVFASGFSYVTSLDVKGDDLYVSNSGGDSISRISMSTGAVTTALSGIVNPHGMSIDSRGDMYVISHSGGQIFRYDFINQKQWLVNIPSYSGTYTGEGFDGLLFWGQYQSGSLYRLRDGDAELFATGFTGGASPPVIGPNDILAQGPDAILVADGHDVWRISRTGSSTHLLSLSLKTDVVAGCKSVSGSVALTGPAADGGVAVTLSDTLTSASVPTTVKIPAGATCRSFLVKSAAVAAEESGTVRATFGQETVSADLTLRPMRLSGFSLTPTSVVGGNTVAGKATLECKAGPGPVEVQLSSSDVTVAGPVASSVFVPQGVQSVTFDVATRTVPSTSKATISGSANGASKSKTLTVIPAASVSPLSLKFGSQLVGTTSGVLSTTLTNRGTSPLSVTGISLTGTGASWFAQTSNCPANLDAGASCTISVTFTPQAALSKTAKLSIATSATSTPLSVSLSGTGI